MEMIEHQAVTIEPEWIPQQGLAQRLQERAVIIIVEDALPIITKIKNVETVIMCDHPRPVAHVGTLQILRRLGNKIKCSDTGFYPEAVAVLPSVFVLAVATPFARPALPVAGAESIFCLRACLSGQRGVDDVHELAVVDLALQQFLPRYRIDVQFPPTWPREEAADLSAMPSLATHSPRRPQAGHSPSVQQKRDDYANHQQFAAILQPESRDPLLETGHRIGDHDHGEAPSSAGENSMIWPL
jgi:hypothetical protein